MLEDDDRRLVEEPWFLLDLYLAYSQLEPDSVTAEEDWDEFVGFCNRVWGVHEYDIADLIRAYESEHNI